jgi:glutathione synthase/RimK-type ligase-like ATP-grasp enzyme
VRTVADKWLKLRTLRSHPDIAVHVPDMRKYSERNLHAMLSEYRLVVIKPLKGTGGAGVVKIERLPDGRYRYHHNYRVATVSSFRTLVGRLRRIRGRRRYMVQQGIRLAQIRGRPVDYRVKMVKQPNGRWRITAVVARVARPGRFVTNLCRGGEMWRGSAALRRIFPARSAKLKKETMRGVARTGTQLLEQRYPGIGSLGYDFGIDRKGSVWILEVNTRPH